jgi:hypothetical protein
MNPIVKAKLKKGTSKLGWTCYWLVDEKDRLLNTEPVCSVPDNYHPWFEKHLELVETEYLGLDEELLEKNG